jgi:Fe-S cluster assembly protein SufD
VEESRRTVMPKGFHEEAFQALMAQRAEPAWLQRLRRHAFELFQSLPTPPRSHEEWRRTDIRLFRWEDYAVLGALAPDERTGTFSVDTLPVHFWENVRLQPHQVIINGDAQPSLVQRPRLPDGVIFCPLEEAVRLHGELLQRYLFQGLDVAYDKFAAAHGAFWSGGLFLYVPRRVELSFPLQAVLALMRSDAADTTHVVIALDEEAEATVLLEWLSPADLGQGLQLSGTEVFVGPGARLRLVTLEDLAPTLWAFRHQRAFVQRDGALHWAVAALGSKLSKVNQEVFLQEAGSGADVHGVMLARGRQHLSYHTRQLHRAGATRSDLLYRGVLMDRARIVWRGMIRVEKGAVKTDAYQRNDNLMLSDHARADSIPGLEILADDVRCTHGATAGHVDEEQVFYMMNRGLDRHQAVHLIVEGFFAAVLDRIPVATVRAALRAALAEKLGFGLREAEEDLELVVT